MSWLILAVCGDVRYARADTAKPLHAEGPLVGTVGFEPTTSSSRTMRATKLRYVPKARSLPV